MSSPSIGAATLLGAATPAAAATPTAATPATTPATSGAAPATTGADTGTTQAAAGAQQAQPQAEPFNAPMLSLPADPSTHDVLDGLTRAMADDTVNKSTADALYKIHQMVFEMEKAAAQVILDGVRS